MSEDRSINGQKSWFGKITQAFAHEPKNRDELLDVLRGAHQNKLLDNEALAKDLLPLILQDDQHSFDIKDLLRPATFVPESKRLNVLLREFRANHSHMAIVIDEYGGVAGLVTIEDVL
ncbi:CBS domain-containing protein, partial [Stutzerimonas nitrititolerans]|uniref:CBS domain-containing protein n=1 Tax=Stutzerimonas nitrititolerans TaxID=2482751 RepID=UPI0028AD90AA